MSYFTYTIIEAAEAIFEYRSAASLATGPFISVPFGTPSSSTITQALSSNWTLSPSGLLNSFFWRITTALNICFLISGVPFLTLTINVSPMPPRGSLFLTPRYFNTEITSTILAPVLSATSILVALLMDLGIFAFIPLILPPQLQHMILSWKVVCILRSLHYRPLLRLCMGDYEHGP